MTKSMREHVGDETRSIDLWIPTSVNLVFLCRSTESPEKERQKEIREKQNAYERVRDQDSLVDKIGGLAFTDIKTQ